MSDSDSAKMKKMNFHGVDSKNHDLLVKEALQNLPQSLVEEYMTDANNAARAELRKINKLGLITVDSQLGEVKKTRNEPKDTVSYAKIYKKHFAWIRTKQGARALEEAGEAEFERLFAKNVVQPTRTQYEKAGGVYYSGPVVSMKERPYLIGHAPVPLARRICRILNHHDNIVAYFTTKHTGHTMSMSRSMSIPVTLALYTQDGAASADKAYPLVEATRVGDEFYLISTATNVPKSHLEKYALVTIVDSRYGHHVVGSPDGLFKRVAKALRRSGDQAIRRSGDTRRR